ncbi:MAG: hypothetical protein DWQ07_04435 [Chloroflexi bacterium]|nr:MAG: hypothetical protein DWQ07_04435 [Chloroflexota bacterium]MBL1194681.1 hypothetical protein [Chloroflexota bacterium]NOH11972.1 hypothetical protein [Chloroflexota bacterium]
MKLEKRSRSYALGLGYGAGIFLVISGLWAAVGIAAIGLGGANWLYLIGIFFVILGLVFAIYNYLQRVRRLPEDTLSEEIQADYQRANMRLGIATAIEAISVAVGAVILAAALDRPEWIGPYVAVVVGLHLIAVAPIYGTQNDYWLAGGIVLVTLIAIFVYPKVYPGWNALIGFTTMILLWLSVLGRIGLGSRVVRVIQSDS